MIDAMVSDIDDGDEYLEKWWLVDGTHSSWPSILPAKTSSPMTKEEDFAASQTQDRKAD